MRNFKRNLTAFRRLPASNRTQNLAKVKIFSMVISCWQIKHFFFSQEGTVIPTFAHFILLSAINPHKFVSVHFKMARSHWKKSQTSVLRLSGCFTLGAVIAHSLVFLTAYNFSVEFVLFDRWLVKGRTKCSKC